MGFRTLRSIIPLAITFIWAASGAAHGQDNAVGGSVHARNGDVPLAGVTVTVVQQPSINDRTREKDAVYLLPVPASLKRFHLKYEHPNFLKAADEDIPNDQRKNKRPIVMLKSNNPTHISALLPDELKQIIDSAWKSKLIGAAENLPLLAEVGTSNLETLANASFVLSNEARQAVAKGDYQKADTLYRASVNIQIGVRIIEAVGTVDEYAALAEKRGDRDLAHDLRERAMQLRGMSNMSTNTQVASLFGVTVNDCQLILLKHSEELRRYLKLVGDEDVRDTVDRCKDDTCLEEIKKVLCSREK